MKVTKLEEVKNLRPNDDPVGRAERVRRYNETMAEPAGKQLWADRAKLVLAYLNNPASFPSGPDGRNWGGEAWYVPGEWRIEGENENRRAVRTVLAIVPEPVTAKPERVKAKREPAKPESTSAARMSTPAESTSALSTPESTPAGKRDWAAIKRRQREAKQKWASARACCSEGWRIMSASYTITYQDAVVGTVTNSFSMSDADAAHFVAAIQAEATRFSARAGNPMSSVEALNAAMLLHLNWLVQCAQSMLGGQAAAAAARITVTSSQSVVPP